MIADGPITAAGACADSEDQRRRLVQFRQTRDRRAAG